MEGMTLYAQRINNGQSEIWLGVDGREMTPRRMLATNEVNNVARRHCSPEIFEAFSRDYYTAIGHVAALTAPNIREIAAELQLKS